MSATAGINQVPASLDVAGLVEAVRGAEPAALFVLPRVLRRVIKQHADLPGFGIRIPHRKSYVIPCEALLEIADREELGLQPDEPVPEQVILLPRPGPAELARASAAEVLTEYWRLLFHARIHMALRQRRSAGELSPPAIRRRIQRIGSTEFDEIRLVLQQEALLLPPWDDGVVYEEFAAVYLELRYFSRSFLPRYFPGIERTERIEGLLAEDVDAQSLFEATRPPGAPDPQDSPAAGTVEQSDRMAAEGDEPQPEAAPERIPSEGTYQRLVRRAEAAAARGNTVRSAIWRAKAEQYAPLASLAQARAALRGDVEHLARRLLAALESRQTDPRPWQETLLALARQAARGIWTAEARLLYDLQKVCVDRERGLYTVDLVEWGLSLGRRPVKRPLPNQQDVLICKHLRSAARRLAAVRLSQANRRRLSTLLHRAAEEAEERLRSRYRPLIGQALHEVGLRPMNLPERIGREKLIEELLDRVLERGFLTVGDLRDGISRNNLKIPDCAELRDFLSGDELLRADKRLAEVLDGVYNRAEIYLRGMLRLSSWAFGTKVGRFLTRFLAVPFGGAFLIVAFVEHLAETIHRHAEPPWQLRLIQVLLLGMFLFGLIHFESFRRGAWRLTRAAFRGLRAAVVRPITWFVHLPLVTWIVRSRLFKLFVRFVFKPLAYTTAAWLTTPLERVQWHDAALLAAAIFLLMNLLLNSRVGRNLEEMAADALVQAWRRFGLRVLTNLFWLLVDLFRWIVQAIERMLYAVDEWLRFRSGQSRMTLVWKGILGLIWFFLTYVIRFCVNLLIEPQINPIKHFPVVTVSHKLLLPMIPALAKMLMAMSVEKHLAATLATAIIFSIPGIFGFLVWELKENWRLYEANRARHLKPVPIGHHGETMMRLLRPGLHSGTVPKRYARLRRAERKARATGNSVSYTHLTLPTIYSV